MLQMLQMIGSGSTAKLYADDVFATWLRTGTGADVVTTTGIDMTKGYCLHTKSRGAVADHAVYHSARGLTKDLATNLTSGETTQATGLKAVSSIGYTVGSLAKMNTLNVTYVDWIFRDAPKFHSHAVVNKVAGSNAVISFPELETLGMVRVKRTDAADSWYVWHRSLTAGQLLIGETTAAETPLGHITVSGATVTLVNGVIADGTYLVEAFAHDTSPNGLIQCGSFTTDASGNATVNLGWEPQFLITKSSTGAYSWDMRDVMRGLANTGDSLLQANLSDAEANYAGAVFIPTATGFRSIGWVPNKTVIYLAIRRPNKTPTTGTEVYNAIARTGTGAAATITGVGFAPDLHLIGNRNQLFSGTNSLLIDRLRGQSQLIWGTATLAETTRANTTSTLSIDGTVLGTDSGRYGLNYLNETYINHFFRRATGVYDQICYNGTGSNKTEPHTLLGVAPELWRAKRRNGVGSWVYGSSLLNANEKIVMPSPNGRVTDATVWNSAYPTATQISLGTHTSVNAAGGTYIVEMWATLNGVSKVGAYTGNGTSQTIDCGFGTGARFIKIIRMTAGVAQDIYIWDTVRGIVAANDPHLSLNTTAAEVTTDDSVDPHASGFIVNQNAATNINVLNARYIYFCVA